MHGLPTLKRLNSEAAYEQQKQKPVTRSFYQVHIAKQYHEDLRLALWLTRAK